MRYVAFAAIRVPVEEPTTASNADVFKSSRCQNSAPGALMLKESGCGPHLLALELRKSGPPMVTPSGRRLMALLERKTKRTL
jgi:hypothetical protein